MSSINVAKYHGLVAAFARAVERQTIDRHVIFEVDSQLLARQVQPFGVGKYACRSPALQQLWLECTERGRHLEQMGVFWEIRHIYKEFNQVSDTLAREAMFWGDRQWFQR